MADGDLVIFAHARTLSARCLHCHERSFFPATRNEYEKICGLSAAVSAHSCGRDSTLWKNGGFFGAGDVSLLNLQSKGQNLSRAALSSMLVLVGPRPYQSVPYFIGPSGLLMIVGPALNRRLTR